METVLDTIVLSSIPLHIIGKDSPLPISFGTGCIVKYSDRYFLITVAHVTDFENTSTLIYLNRPPENGNSVMYNVGGLTYYHVGTTDQFDIEDENIVDSIINDENSRIDFACCEINGELTINQPEIELEIGKIKKGLKCYVDLDTQIGVPNNELFYAFFGSIKQKKLNETRIESTLTLKYDIKFHRSESNYNVFLVKDIIKDSDDYRGCSGSPIFDENGKFVGLATAVRENTKMVYALKTEDILGFLNYFIGTQENN
ncbi:MAG: serine protease [Sphingobacterium sp.]|jgi:hypothetical protein|uniref:hypothetical protein n=1 Tax=Sphingobacterium sp. TaxID=341027 RepID=UPI002849A680|nr:hypothetical protein [Sphingobacterium sp.]MDR3008576.1 serine protease [Sphingobacterium sp.]